MNRPQTRGPPHRLSVAHRHAGFCLDKTRQTASDETDKAREIPVRQEKQEVPRAKSLYVCMRRFRTGDRDFKGSESASRATKPPAPSTKKKKVAKDRRRIAQTDSSLFHVCKRRSRKTADRFRNVLQTHTVVHFFLGTSTAKEKNTDPRVRVSFGDTNRYAADRSSLSAPIAGQWVKRVVAAGCLEHLKEKDQSYRHQPRLLYTTTLLPRRQRRQ